MNIKEIAKEYAELFKQNDWHWCEGNQGDRIPGATEIEAVIRSRIESLKQNPYPDSMSYISMGRIQVSKHKLPEKEECFYRVCLLPYVVREDDI